MLVLNELMVIELIENVKSHHYRSGKNHWRWSTSWSIKSNNFSLRFWVMVHEMLSHPSGQRLRRPRHSACWSLQLGGTILRAARILKLAKFVKKIIICWSKQNCLHVWNQRKLTCIHVSMEIFDCLISTPSFVSCQKFNLIIRISLFKSYFLKN